jgi:hypothetical protein
MRTWEEAKVMELNINETATSADEAAEAGFWGFDPWAGFRPGNNKPGNNRPGNNGGCGNSGSTGSTGSTGSGSDSSDSFVDSLS